MRTILQRLGKKAKIVLFIISHVLTLYMLFPITVVALNSDLSSAEVEKSLQVRQLALLLPNQSQGLFQTRCRPVK